MQAVVATIAGWIGGLIDVVRCYLGSLFFCSLFNLFFDLVGGAVTVVAGAIAWVPIPSEITSWSWPDAGPIAGVLGEVGFAQALGIVASAMSIKFLLRLIPFVRL